jgi:hypothetical protein
MSYRIINGLEENIRPVLKRRIETALEKISDSVDFRKWLRKPRYGSGEYAIRNHDPVTMFLVDMLPTRLQVTSPREGVRVQDYASKDYPILSLDLPGWARRFQDRWWEIRDAKATAPELDDDGSMPLENVFALLDEVGA